MKGVLSIEGANTFAWIEGRPLFECITPDQSQIEYQQQQGAVIIWKVGEVFVESEDGRFAKRYPIKDMPDFSWCLEPVEEVEIRLSIDHTGHRDSFLMPIADLSYDAEGYSNFRQWALARYREWAATPGKANGLLPLLAEAETLGWEVTGYTVPETNRFTTSPKSQRDPVRNYVVTFRKPGREHTVMAPSFVGFKRSLEAAVASLEELYEGGENAQGS